MHWNLQKVQAWSSRRRDQTSLALSLCGLPIKQEKTTRFLGVVFQENLNWTSYIDNDIRRATSRIHIIKRLAAKDRWRSPHKSIYFFESLVRPLFDYGAVCYASMGAPNWNKIDQMHSRFIRAVCNVPSKCSYDRLINQLHQERLSSAIKSRAANRVIGMCSTSPYGSSWECTSAVQIIGKRVTRIPTAPTKCTYKSSMRLLLHRAADES